MKSSCHSREKFGFQNVDGGMAVITKGRDGEEEGKSEREEIKNSVSSRSCVDSPLFNMCLTKKNWAKFFMCFFWLISVERQCFFLICCFFSMNFSNEKSEN